jgi:hypothetical protein
MKRRTFVLAASVCLFAAVALPAIRAIAQPGTVTEDNLDQAIANAKTPADHQAIAAFFQQQADEAKKKAALHREWAATYRKMAIPKPAQMAEMCDGIARMWDRIAADDEKLAKEHSQMAKKVGS